MIDMTSNSVGLRAVRRQLVMLVASALFCAGAAAHSLGTTFTDLWWNPAESGWGVTIDHQQDVMFLTFFVYRSDRSPYWVTAVLNFASASSSAMEFAGDVYETNGPAFGGSFNPALVTERKVGTATFSAPNPLSATLRYTLDGTTVTKNIVRQTLQNINRTGSYLGGTAYKLYNCSNPADNNATIADSGSLTITHSGNYLQVRALGEVTNCTMSGTYAQDGSVGRVDNGTYSCTDGARGTFSMYGMQWTFHGMTAGIYGQNQWCRFYGFLGGILSP